MLGARVGMLAAFAMFAACGTKDAAGPLQPSGPTGRVRLVNLITDATRGRVNASLEGVPFAVDVQYAVTVPATLAAPSTAFYAAVLAGNRAFVLKRTADTSVTVATLNFTVADGQDVTVYAIGGASNSAITGFVTTDENPVAAANQTRLRAVHLSPTAGNVDIFLTALTRLGGCHAGLTNGRTASASAYLLTTPRPYHSVPSSGTAPALRRHVSINLASWSCWGHRTTIVTADNTWVGRHSRLCAEDR